MILQIDEILIGIHSTSFLDLPPPYGSIFEESENYLPPPG